MCIQCQERVILKTIFAAFAKGSPAVERVRMIYYILNDLQFAIIILVIYSHLSTLWQLQISSTVLFCTRE